MTATRRLAAILAVDVVGYSRLMGEDEAGTAQAVREHREAARPIVAALGGRIVKTMGDGLLLEFPSVVAAVECAIAIQKLMAERNAETPEAKRIVYRIGVNLGDVLIEGDDILGDGVNIAARLEGLCEPGGVLISGAAYEHVRGRIEAEFVDLGEKALKNIARPVRVYSLTLRSQFVDGSPGRTAKAGGRSAVHCRAAVHLFFRGARVQISDGGDDRGFDHDPGADSRLHRDRPAILLCLSGPLGRQPPDRARARRPLYRRGQSEARRPAASRRRATHRRDDRGQLWADRFDGQAENVLELQDQIARAIASRIEPELVRAEIALIRRRRDANPSAWSCYRQGAGLISLKGWSEETLTQATALLRQAATLDPDFALARAQLALFLSLGARLGLIADAAAAVTEARTEAERAVAIDHDASEVLGYAGCALAELGDVQRGSEILERAIENDPSNAQAWVALGTSLCFLEKMGDAGLEKLRQGMRLSPRDHRLGFWGTFYALALARHRRLEEAHEEARAACRRDPQFYVRPYRPCAHRGRPRQKEEAVAALREAKRLRPRLSPGEIRAFGWGGVARPCSLRSGTRRRASRDDQGHAASRGSGAPVETAAERRVRIWRLHCLMLILKFEAPNDRNPQTRRDHGDRRRRLLAPDGRGRGGDGAQRARPSRGGAADHREHGGRIVKTMGDGLLLEFPSVVAAVECAVAIQKLMAERNAGTPEPDASSIASASISATC